MWMPYQEDQSKGSKCEGNGKWGRNMKSTANGRGTWLSWFHRETPASFSACGASLESLGRITARGSSWSGVQAQTLSVAYFCQSLPHIVGLCKRTALGRFSCPNIWGFIWDQKWWKALLSAEAQSICSRCQSWLIPAMAEIMLGPG